MEIVDKLLLNFDDIFGDKPLELDAKDLLKYVPREHAIRIGLLLSNTTKDIPADETIHNLGFETTLPPDIIELLLNRPIHNAEYELELTNIQTGLELLKNAYSISPKDFKNPRNIFEMNFALLLAILKINSELLKNNPRFKDKSGDKFYKHIRSKKYEIDPRISLYSTFYRALMLNRFFNTSSDKWRKLRDTFLNTQNLSSFADYINIIDYLTKDIPFEPRKTNVIFRFHSKGYMTDFLDRLSLTLEEIVSLKENVDYTAFKNKPFVKLRNYHYGVISNVFVSNLFYLHFRFALSKINSETGVFKNFQVAFTTEFIQNFLFTGLLEYTFCNEGLLLTDTDCHNRIKYAKQMYKLLPSYGKCSFESLTNSPPDGYFRKDNKILLFECKGMMISQEAILNPSECAKVVSKSLIGNHGTGQLLRNCDRIDKHQFLWDEINLENLEVYPILLCDDYNFSSDGFNRLLNEATKDKLNTITYPITVLDMDTFILASDLIKSGMIDIFSEIKNYHAYCQRRLSGHSYTLTELLHCQDVSFSVFLMSRYELKSPEITNDFIKELAE